MAQLPPSAMDGEPAPTDGSLPTSAAVGASERAFGVYLHVPYCTVRCGYCDFNTYTSTELGGGASQASYAETAIKEIELAARVLTEAGVAPRPISTFFVGGGTPTVLPAMDLVRMFRASVAQWGLAPGAEVTTEANPDSVTKESLRDLSAWGFTRISIGMQSAVPHVLHTLERSHRPKNVAFAVQEAREAGLDVSLDLIYGTPGESLDDWRRSLDAAIELQPDHISAYALVVEPGTKMGAQVRRGELPLPDDDDEAAKYELAEVVLAEAGYGWYEVSNWAKPGPTDDPNRFQCQHNLAYWRSADWWGVGPGAHSHVGGVRWWNVKHPRAYSQRLDAGESPAMAREVLDAETRSVEEVLLRVRLSEGLPIAMLDDEARVAVAGLVADGLVDGRAALGGTVVLTLRGRLLADTVVRALT